ncbi:MAG: isoprenyl transferase [Luteibaculaceae bacterium]
MDFKSQINLEKLPNHVAIIMDGNGRWAKLQGKDRVFGHSHGVESVRNALTAAGELGLKYLTLYAFSTENWGRPKTEVNALMNLLVDVIHSEVEELSKNNVRLNAIGDLESLPHECFAALQEAIALTAKNTGVTLTLALSYSAKWELTEAVKKIAEKVKSGFISINDISEDLIHNNLCTHNLPDPELLIRTGGEARVSNFLLWQIAYAELYFTKTHWPEFSKNDFFKAVLDYQTRERRFGKISEQIVP